MKRNKPTIGVLGLWHLGCIYATSFAELGYEVTGYDLTRQTVDDLNQGTPPIYEPGLTEKLKNFLGKNLFFTFQPQEAIKGKKYVFVALDIPVDDHDQMDLRPLNKLLTVITRYASFKHTTVVISSQVPLGTCREFLKRANRRKQINVIYFPENIRLGTAFQTFLKPDRIILGLEKKSLLTQFVHDFPNFTCPILTMNLESAEMVKHALNSFLAVCISYASEIGDLCELLGANYDDVVGALRTDSRIGSNAPLNPGTGFAGGTIGRDVQILRKLSKGYDYRPKMIEVAYEINKSRLARLLKKIQSLYPKLDGKKIGLLGLTYKPGTNTLRRSKSLELSKLIHARSGIVIGYDPAIRGSIPGYPYIQATESLADFFQDLDAVVIMTPCPEFKKVSLKLMDSMRNKVIFDSVNLLDRNKFLSNEIKYFRTGR